MRLSQYAKKTGVSYKTAYRWWKAGKLNAYQMPSGAVIVREDDKAKIEAAALYIRVARESHPQAEGQLENLRQAAAERHYTVVQEVTEIASSLDDKRPGLTKLLLDPTVSVILAEEPSRITRFGLGYLQQILASEGRRIEFLRQTDEIDDEVVSDLLEIITRLTAGYFGRKGAAIQAEKIRQFLENELEKTVTN